MKKILFIVTYLDTGGITTSLINLLSILNHVEVDVFAMSHQGIFSNELPNCKLLKKDWLLNSLISRFNQSEWQLKTISIITKLIDRLTRGKLRDYAFKRVTAKIEKETSYDAVIGFSEGIPTILATYFACQNKIAWIHCDYTSYIKQNKIDEAHIYKNFKHIICVSNFTKNSFINSYPTFKDKTIYIYNVLDTEQIRAKANSFKPEMDSRSLNIISVGRIDPVKRFSAIPEIASKIIANGFNIKWRIIGPIAIEDEYNKLIDGIRKFNLESSIELLGEMSNPYPYILCSNLLVSTSISEACPYVINEAKTLHTPVLCTDFGSSHEFISNGKTGIISPIELMDKAFIELFSNDHTLYDLIKNNLNSYEYNNNSIIAQFKEIL